MGKEFSTHTNTEVLLYRILNQLSNGLTATVDGGADYGVIENGRKVVATAGTAEALAASTAVKMVTVQAELSNTGVITIGTTTVDAAEPTRTGIALEAGDTITLDLDDLAKVYIDATVNGEGVTFVYFN
jgi:hypothetical protein